MLHCAGGAGQPHINSLKDLSCYRTIPKLDLGNGGTGELKVARHVLLPEASGFTSLAETVDEVDLIQVRGTHRQALAYRTQNGKNRLKTIDYTDRTSPPNGSSSRHVASPSA